MQPTQPSRVVRAPPPSSEPHSTRRNGNAAGGRACRQAGRPWTGTKGQARGRRRRGSNSSHPEHDSTRVDTTRQDFNFVLIPPPRQPPRIHLPQPPAMESYADMDGPPSGDPREDVDDKRSYSRSPIPAPRRDNANGDGDGDGRTPSRSPAPPPRRSRDTRSPSRGRMNARYVVRFCLSLSPLQR